MSFDDTGGADVSSVVTAAEYVALLRRVRDESGLTYREIERRAVTAGHWLPRSTLATVLSRATLPREELVVALLTACGRQSAEVDRWLGARQEIAEDVRVLPAAAPGDSPADRVPAPAALPSTTPLPADGVTTLPVTTPLPADGVTTLPVTTPLPADGVSVDADPPAGTTPAGGSATTAAGGVPTGDGVVRTGWVAWWAPWRRTKSAMAVLAGTLIAGLVGVFVLILEPSAGARRPASETPLLLSETCSGTLAIGAVDECVQALQERLQARGFDLPADAWFGPYTKMRVMAFQTLAGLSPTSMVDEPVKRALYADDTRVASWPRTEVERVLRAEFPEDPDGAVRIATCLSELDPYWIMGYADGSRRWGLFQFSDRELMALGAEPRSALSLEWNLRAARAVWDRTRDFSHWTCPLPG